MRGTVWCWDYIEICVVKSCDLLPKLQEKNGGIR